MKKSALNATAYRIFRMLQWLSRQPMSVADLNAAFKADPLIGRPVSEDSIWLYINTLKQLGCRIARPTPSNGFCYQMLAHPFGIQLAPEDIETMVYAKLLADQQMKLPELLYLDRFFRHVIEASALGDKASALRRYQEGSRSLDYEGRWVALQEILPLMHSQQALQITYHPEDKPPKTFEFFARGIVNQWGGLYLQGRQPGKDEPVMLRLDRIVSVRPIEDTEVLQRLKQSLGEEESVVIRLFGLTAQLFEPWGMGEVWQDVSTEAGQFLEIRLQTDHWFLLRDRIFATGVPFQVITPLSFREQMAQTLRGMKAFYAEVAV